MQGRQSAPTGVTHFPHAMPLMALWTSRDGTRCELTRVTEGPPFHVVILRRSGDVQRHTFDTHTDAAAFAIAEMKAEFSAFKNDQHDQHDQQHSA